LGLDDSLWTQSVGGVEANPQADLIVLSESERERERERKGEREEEGCQERVVTSKCHLDTLINVHGDLRGRIALTYHDGGEGAKGSGT
jgi:hypothetical protein